MATQGECIWIHQKLMAELIKTNRRHFQSAEYASIQVPTYPCGQISAFVLSKSKNTCSVPLRNINTTRKGGNDNKNMQLRYYTSEMHQAAFVLPAFVQDSILNA